MKGNFQLHLLCPTRVPRPIRLALIPTRLGCLLALTCQGARAKVAGFRLVTGPGPALSGTDRIDPLIIDYIHESPGK
jgi:hypothetical protein